jgi:cysteine synthase
MRVLRDIVGNTLVELRNVAPPQNCGVFLKLKFYNPTGSNGIGHA